MSVMSSKHQVNHIRKNSNKHLKKLFGLIFLPLVSSTYICMLLKFSDPFKTLISLVNEFS